MPNGPIDNPEGAATPESQNRGSGLAPERPRGPSRFPRVFAWLVMVDAAIGAAYAIGILSSNPLLLPSLLIAAGGFLGGYFYLRGKRWGYLLGMLYLAIQIPECHSEKFDFNYQAGIEVALRPGTIDDLGRPVPGIVVNLAAALLFMLGILALTFDQGNASTKQ